MAADGEPGWLFAAQDAGHRRAAARGRARAADRHPLRVRDPARRRHRPLARLQEPREGHLRGGRAVRRHRGAAARADRLHRRRHPRDLPLPRLLRGRRDPRAAGARGRAPVPARPPRGGPDPLDRGRHGRRRHGEADPRQRPDPRGLPRPRQAAVADAARDDRPRRAGARADRERARRRAVDAQAVRGRPGDAVPVQHRDGAGGADDVRAQPRRHRGLAAARQPLGRHLAGAAQVDRAGGQRARVPRRPPEALPGGAAAAARPSSPSTSTARATSSARSRGSTSLGERGGLTRPRPTLPVHGRSSTHRLGLRRAPRCSRAAAATRRRRPRRPRPPTATETATATRDRQADAAIEADAVAKMPEVPVGAVGTLPPPASAKVHDPGLLHTAFESAETMWEREFGAAGSRYQHAKLVFFHSTVRTKCGEQSRETGPFYCPAGLRGLPQHDVLRRPGAQVRPPERVRRRLHHRPRGRPPRAGAARRPPARRGGQRERSRRRQRPLDPGRAAGRLLRGRVAAHRVRARAS